MVAWVEQLTISVVAPAYNEEKYIGNLLQALSLQTRPADEIIIVDDGSTDRTAEIVNEYAKTLTTIRLTTTTHEGVNAARHKGTMRSNASIIVQTDADIIPPTDWLERIYNHFNSDPELIGVTGRVVDYKKRMFERIASFIANKMYDGMACNTAYKKEAYLKTEGYPQDVPIHHGGDVVFWEEFKKTGKCIYDPHLVVAHESGYKWRLVGLAAALGATAITGLLVRRKYKNAGNFILGTGAGVAASEVGTLIAPKGIRIPTSDDEGGTQSSIHIHHDVIGVLGLLSTLALDKSGKIKRKTPIYVSYGAFTGLTLHHMITEPMGGEDGTTLRNVNKCVL